MKKICLLLLLLCFCVPVLQAQTNNSSAGSPQTTKLPEAEKRSEEIVPNIPKAVWEKIFFESINQRTNEAGIKSLRETAIASEDIEIRVWIGFGLSKLKGFIMNRVKNTWSAKYITGEYGSKEFGNRIIQLKEPESGWEKNWQKLIDSEILTLPDAEAINCSPDVFDGTSYVVELKKGNNYRTYMYDNPDYSFAKKCREAGKMLKIIRIISEEFDLKDAKK
jgi:hypothetical protein